MMPLFFIGLTIFLTVIGQISVKWGMSQSPIPLHSTPFQVLLNLVTNIGFMAGMLCALLAAVSWAVAISRVKLSFAYPFTALSIVLVLALTPLVFGEYVPPSRWLGVAIVAVGIFIAAQG